MQFTDILFKAVQENNLSIHSVVGKKPRDIMFGTTIPNDPEKSKENRKKIVEKISGKQKTDLDYHNKEKNEIRNYEQGETVYVKIDKRLGSKLTPRYKKEIVAENLE